MDAPLPEMRIGDQERRAVDTRLQEAHADGMLTLTEYDERAKQCWTARTRAELEVLTRDLPAPAPEPGTQPVAGTRAAPARSSRSPLGRLAGVLGGVAAAAVLGYSVISVIGAADGAAVFGDRQIAPVPGQDRVQVGLLFGDYDVVVPDGTRVRSAGTVVFGDFLCQQACQAQAPGARELVVDASGGFGDVRVLTETEQRALPPGSDRGRDRDDD